MVVALAFAMSAWAQSPAQNAYSGVGASQISQATGTPCGCVMAASAWSAGSSSGSSSSALPFTGLDIGAIVLAGAVLGGTGFALRRWSKSHAN